MATTTESWSDMPKVKYVGPVTKIVTLLDGRERHLTRDETVDVSEAQAERLVSDPTNWKKVGGRPSAPPEDNDTKEEGD